VKRAGSAVELRPAPKARSAAHPQERQHSAAEGGTRDRVRPAGALHMRHLRHALRQGPSPGWAETRMEMVAYGGSVRGSGRHAPRARPEGDAKKVCRSKHRSNFWFRTARSA
jgi:hypothetical protein